MKNQRQPSAKDWIDEVLPLLPLIYREEARGEVLLKSELEDWQLSAVFYIFLKQSDVTWDCFTDWRNNKHKHKRLAQQQQRWRIVSEKAYLLTNGTDIPVGDDPCVDSTYCFVCECNNIIAVECRKCDSWDAFLSAPVASLIMNNVGSEEKGEHLEVKGRCTQCNIRHDITIANTNLSQDIPLYFPQEGILVDFCECDLFFSKGELEKYQRECIKNNIRFCFHTLLMLLGERQYDFIVPDLLPIF